ncbi:MAG: hypothetical protein QOF92_3137, partial [Pseudonocardiales bacterium]|nr:hypothetical protein [Pseudonocardiales bacterium]
MHSLTGLVQPLGLHEVAHLMLREGGLCELLEPQSDAGEQTGLWCNAVAAAILMPAEACGARPTLAEP